MWQLYYSLKNKNKNKTNKNPGHPPTLGKAPWPYSVDILLQLHPSSNINIPNSIPNPELSVSKMLQTVVLSMIFLFLLLRVERMF